MKIARKIKINLNRFIFDELFHLKIKAFYIFKIILQSRTVAQCTNCLIQRNFRVKFLLPYFFVSIY